MPRRNAVTSRPRRRKSPTRSIADHGYPRPQLVRDNWTSLNGPWDFALDAEARWSWPRDVKWESRIIVPFSPETPASGIGNTGFYNACWYRRTFERPAIAAEQRLILHFEAVDYSAQVWVNDCLAVAHEGGYTPFCADITDHLSDNGSQTVVVRAVDDPHDLTKPRGKQDWQLDPHSIWYPRTTGIWQSVWMEVVPATRMESLSWLPSLQRWEFGLQARISGPRRDSMRLHVRLLSRGKTISDDLYSLSDREVLRKIALPDPGIDDYRNEILWWPWSPNLIDAELELLDEQAQVLDRVRSYTAMRSVAAQGDRFVLNGRPFMLRMLLDQGYWPQSGLTAPDDEAFRRDIELVKAMGFNGVRKHQKIESQRFLYWADRMGLLVWEEMPSPYRFDAQTIHRLINEWSAVIQRDISHPCIVTWVPFNESWGVPDLPGVEAQRDFVAGVYRLTKAMDPSRPVVGNDGWEMVATDVIAIHDYEKAPQRLVQRYMRTSEKLASLFAYERPGHRQLLLDGQSYEGLPIMLTEFGGIAFHKDVRHTWGYRRAGSAVEFERQYRELLAAVRSLPLFAGFCYTQFTDTYQEANGLLYMDRTPKIRIKKIAKATGG